jgi:DNA-binding NarL/FixJ family response regulator
VIVLSHTPTVEYVQDLIKAGASGCLSRESAGAELVAAVEKVNSQGVYLSPALADRVVARYVQPTPKNPKRTLAPREREVLRRIAAGQCTKEIALAMGVSSKTIETHRCRIMQKLDRHNVAELTKYALANGLATLEPAI